MCVGKPLSIVHLLFEVFQQGHVLFSVYSTALYNRNTDGSGYQYNTSKKGKGQGKCTLAEALFPGF